MKTLHLKNPNSNDGETISPFQLCFTNNTDETKKVCFLEVFEKNPDGVVVEQLNTINVSFEFIRRYFYENPHLTNLIRIQSAELNSMMLNNFYRISKYPKGQMSSISLFSPVELFNKNQFQNGIIDLPCNMIVDGLSEDLYFDISPKTKLNVTIFFQDRMHGRDLEKLKEFQKMSINKRNYVSSFIIQNTSDNAKELLLFDESKMEEYINDKELCFESYYLSNYKSFINYLKNFKKTFNSIRTFVLHSDDVKRQVRMPFEFNSGNKYFPYVELDGSEFNENVNDINIISEELSVDNQMKVTILPNTKVCFIFKNIDNIIPTSVNKEFVSIRVENTSNEDKQIDILRLSDGDIKHSIDFNKINFDRDDFKANEMRIFFGNKYQLERPVIFNGNGSKEIYPINHLNEYKFNMHQSIDVEFDFCDTPLLKSQLIFDLKSGEYVDVLFFKNEKLKDDAKDIANVSNTSFEIINVNQNKQNEDRLNWIQIKLQNKTDQYKNIVLYNSLEQESVIPEGVDCVIGLNKTYTEFLNSLSKECSGLILKKIYGKDKLDHKRVINLIDFTDENDVKQNTIILQSYVSHMSFNVDSISIPDLKLLSVQKDENNKVLTKEKIEYNLPPNSTIYLCFSIKKESNPISETSK